MKKIVLMAALGAIVTFGSCTSKEAKVQEAEADFEKSQPLQNGTYDATQYEITGENARKGMFDGRMLVSLSQDVSAIYVYENGNRAKIDYLIMLDKAFEKTDSGTYNAIDKKGKTVILRKDSVYSLAFEKNDSKIKIDFDSVPRSTATAMEMLEKINELKTK